MTLVIYFNPSKGNSILKNSRATYKTTATTTMSTQEQENTDAIRNKLEEIDEFEDFPVDNWPDSDTIKGTAAAIAGANGQKASLWQEDWNDVEVDDDFAKNLKTELETIRAQQLQQQQQQQQQ